MVLKKAGFILYDRLFLLLGVCQPLLRLEIARLEQQDRLPGGDRLGHLLKTGEAVPCLVSQALNRPRNAGEHCRGLLGLLVCHQRIGVDKVRTSVGDA